MPLFRQITNLFLKRSQFFYGGIIRDGLKFNLGPAITTNLGQTLVTSKLNFKSDNDKSKPPVKQNVEKIAESKEIKENADSLILAIAKKKKHKCPHCPKYYATNGTLKQHIKDVHLRLKPFKCDVCGDCFAQQATLDRHKASKHAENLKPLECPDCSEKFKHSKELDTHIRQFHTVTDHQCPKCNMYCTTKGNLNQHIDSCLNIRKFECPECKEKFGRKYALDNHMKCKHSDERNYVCEVKGCGNKFKTQSALTKHMKSHSDERTHQCPYCDKTYKTNEGLLCHVYLKHPEKYKEGNDPDVEE